MSEKYKFLSLLKFNRATFFLSAAVLCLCFNLYALVKDTQKMTKIRKHIPPTFLGDRFRGIESFVGKAPLIGYYTDRSLDDNRAARQFAQAQLVLAPSILDFNNTAHEFIIFDCSKPAVAMAKIQEIGARALKANSYGIILARNPDHAAAQPGNNEKTFDKTKQKQRP